ncbi:CopG family transcriptional regulator [Kluyvera georgiana]|uniref:ribbon-helix-helix domain-containing protein n=1 Tax=Kluyvera georgiana TaxID=73098 RepID=UPI003D9837CA
MSMMTERDMGRILLDLSDEVIRRLDELKQQRNMPRAELLREAVEMYLEKQNQAEQAIAGALGIWQECEDDGVEFERQLREEWTR